MHLQWLAFGLCLLGLTHVEAQSPGQLLDLARWKLTLPVDSDLPGRPDEVVQPQLAPFIDRSHFFVQEGGVVFRAPVGGVATRGSSYPRCELREMAAGGKEEARWSTDDATGHTLTMRAAITKTPAKKPHVVCAQIHDAKDDLLMVRLEGEKLFIERTEGGDMMLERRYRLGTPFTLRIQAGSGRVKAWFDEELRLDWPISKSGCYFKAGCYVQSNPERGEKSEDYGKVVIYELAVK